MTDMWLTKWLSTTPPGAQTSVHDTYECHIVPVGDMREHVFHETCWCEPIRADEPPYEFVHNSADRREEFESGQRKPS